MDCRSNTRKVEGHYTLENICTPGCPCKSKDHHTHLNLVRKNNGSDLPAIKWINIRGREEHETLIKDMAMCKDLGVDQAYEIMKYFQRWGSWLTK